MKQKTKSPILSVTVNGIIPLKNLEIDHIKSLDSCIEKNTPNGKRYIPTRPYAEVHRKNKME